MLTCTCLPKLILQWIHSFQCQYNVYIYFANSPSITISFPDVQITCIFSVQFGRIVHNKVFDPICLCSTLFLQAGVWYQIIKDIADVGIDAIYCKKNIVWLPHSLQRFQTFGFLLIDGVTFSSKIDLFVLTVGNAKNTLFSRILLLVYVPWLFN